MTRDTCERRRSLGVSRLGARGARRTSQAKTAGSGGEGGAQPEAPPRSASEEIEDQDARVQRAVLDRQAPARAQADVLAEALAACQHRGAPALEVGLEQAAQ